MSGGCPGSSATKWASQIFSYIVRAGIIFSGGAAIAFSPRVKINASQELLSYQLSALGDVILRVQKVGACKLILGFQPKSILREELARYGESFTD
jgi:hypothetical protein